MAARGRCASSDPVAKSQRRPPAALGHGASAAADHAVAIGARVLAPDGDLVARDQRRRGAARGEHLRGAPWNHTEGDGPREVARMTLIMRGRRFGFTLEEVRQWLMIYDDEGSAAQMRVLFETSDQQIAKLNAQIDDLVDARDELIRLRDELAESLD